MATGTITNTYVTPTTGSATIGSNISSSSYINYSQFGKMVVFSGTIITTAAISAGAVIMTGMPSASVVNAAIRATNNNSANSYYDLLIDYTSLKAGGAGLPNGASIRVVGAYLTT